MAKRQKHTNYKSAERRKAEAVASRNLASLPTTFPISDQVRPFVDSLDAVATQMEARWGVGRLEQLVDVELATKVRNQRERVDEAMYGSNLEAQRKTLQSMQRAWEALDKRATELGRDRIGEKWFEVETRRGLIAVASDIQTAERVQREHPNRFYAAVHAQALGAVLDSSDKLLDFIAAAPLGSVTIRKRTTTGDDKSPFNDSLPF